MIKSFVLKYDLLSQSMPKLGKVAIVPWDSKLFNFNVGQYEIGIVDEILGNKNILMEKLEDWALDKEIKLIGCEINSQAVEEITILQEQGFYFVESTLEMSLKNLDKVNIPKSRFKVRFFKKKDLSKVIEIANSSFNHGKYYADSRISNDLAGLRYEYWVKNAIQMNSENNHIYVLEVNKNVLGFFHVLCDGKTADLRLMAIENKHQHGVLGYFFFIGVFDLLKKNKITNLTAKISSSNLSILNFYNSFSFRCTNNKVLFHKHIS